MTDFGGAGHGGTIAECELNLPEQSVAGCSTLTSSDLNELGCTSSTSAKSTASSSGISSAKSDHSKRRGSSTGHNSHTNSVRSASLLSLFRKSRSTTQKPPPSGVRSRSTADTPTGAPHHHKQPKPDRRARSSSSRIFVEILRTLTSGFANCSKKRNNDDNHSRRGSNSCSNSDAISNNLDLLNQYPNSTGRRKSHDGSHDGTNGSDSTSTGYVSDSSNEKHYPKNNSTGKKPAATVTTISQQVDDAKAAELATAWSAAIKTAATIRRPTPVKTDSPPDPPDDEIEGAPEQNDEEIAPTSSSNRDSTSSERANSYELIGDTGFCYIPSSASEEEVTGTEDSLYTTGTESGSSDYETNETSSYEEETDEKEIKATKRNALDIIKEEDEEESQNVTRKAVKRRKSTLKRKRTLKGQDDLKSGMKSTLASLKAKEEDAVSRTGSLKDMILQFETAVAALEINENRIEAENPTGNKDIDTKSPLQGVKAIAQKIQEQTRLEYTEVELMPPSQILKLKQALELEPDNLSQPIPLSRRSESRVAQIARQLAEAERQRVQMEKAAAKSGKSPKAMKKQSSTSFINELLEMARAESVDKLNEPSNHDEAPDFKQSLLAARKKITQREDEVKQMARAGGLNTLVTITTAVPLLTIQPTVSASSMNSETGSEGVSSNSGPNVNEEIDPFVKEVLRSKTVPEPVKQKIRIECWSLFNDPRTPKGVKQCILATMLSKVQNE